jgi:Pyruvate/2-oxoacid:ferredoxin oxidoreductase gamma subunit
MEVGILENSVKPEFGTENRKLFGRKARVKPVIIEKKFNNKLDQQVGIVIAGEAGQKVKSAATTFGRAGMLAGLLSSQKDDYPITIMTGHSVSEINLSPYTIDYTAIEIPEYFVVISEGGLKKTWKQIQNLPKSCKLFIEESLELPETRAQVFKLPFAATAKKVGRLSIGIISLGAVIKDSGMFPLVAFEEAISRFQDPKVAEANINAARSGAKMLS